MQDAPSDKPLDEERPVSRQAKTERELLELGAAMQTILDSGYTSKRKALLFNFIKGMVTGAGAFIGGTLVISVVLWMLSLFDTIPFLGDIAEKALDTIQGSGKF